MGVFRGVIIEESLKDPKVLGNFKIVSTKVSRVTEKDKTPWLKQWTLHTVEIDEHLASALAQEIKTLLVTDIVYQGEKITDSWYADWKNEALHYFIFPQKVFVVDRHRKSDYEAVTSFGISIGIPAHQLDFSRDLLS